MWQPAPLLPLSSAEQVILEAVAASDSAEIPDRVRSRASIVLRAVVADCLYRPRLSMLIEDDDPSLRWTVRNLALRHGISRASVGRICQKHGIEMAGLNGINIAAKHAEAQNHLLLHLGAPDYPPVQEWLATQPRIQLHRAPLAPPNGAQWTELAEHWLKVIAAWPMQASLVDSVQRMTQLLATYPPDQLDQLAIIS